MRRYSMIAGVLTGAVFLCFGAASQAGQAADGGYAEVVRDKVRTVGETPAPPSGIRSYGTGSERRDTSVMVGVGSGVEPIAPTGGSTRISGTPMVGSVVAFAVSPDGKRAVYIADQQSLGRFELFSVPVDGSATAVKISGTLPFGAGDQGVRLFRITPDSQNVVFLADPFTGGGTDDIFSVPIDGAASPSQLNQTAQRPITGVGVLPNGTQAAFFGNSGGRVELFRANVNVAGSAVRVSNASANNAGNVVAADFAPDSSRIVYAADQGVDNVYQWHSVATSATGPGQDVQLSAALGTVSLAVISPNSATVVYSADQTTAGTQDLYSVPITGGNGVKINSAMAGSGVVAIRVASDSSRVAYIADQVTAGVNELFSATIGLSGSDARLNTALSGAQNVNFLTISPDGTTVLYEADENAEGTVDLLQVPIDGSGQPTTLHALQDPQDAGFFAALGIPIFGPRAVYPVIGDQVNVFSVSMAGTATLDQVNDPLATGDTVFNAFVPFNPDANRLMAWGVGATQDGVTRRIFVGPMRPDLAAEQINTTAGAGSTGVLGYEVTSDESYGVYLQDQNTNGKPELYASALDSDADGVPNPDDNCNFVANSSQSLIAFGQTVAATSKTSFGWGQVTDARFVRGPLTGVSTYQVDAAGPLVEATSYTDSSVPDSASGGFYYLFAIDCSPGGSFQTTVGAEPGRDAALQ